MSRRSRQRTLTNRKRRIQHRLREIKWRQQPEPMYKASNIHYDLSDRTRGLDAGGIGAMHRLARHTGLVEEIDRRIQVLKMHLPYHESDHVLGIAYNILCGGTCLQDIELRRNNEVYLNALGAQRIPDPTTAGGFCRRFDNEVSIEALMTAINEPRVRVWQRQSSSFFREAIIDVDGTLAMYRTRIPGQFVDESYTSSRQFRLRSRIGGARRVKRPRRIDEDRRSARRATRSIPLNRVPPTHAASSTACSRTCTGVR